MGYEANALSFVVKAISGVGSPGAITALPRIAPNV